MSIISVAVAGDGIALAGDSHTWGLDSSGSFTLDEPDQVKVLPLWDRYAVALAGIEHIVDPLRYPPVWLQGKATLNVPEGMTLKPHEQRGESAISYILELAEDELEGSPPASFDDFCAFLERCLVGCLERERNVLPERARFRAENGHILLAIAAGFEGGTGFVRELRFGVSPELEIVALDPASDLDESDNRCVATTTADSGHCWVRGLARVGTAWLEANPGRWSTQDLPHATDAAVGMIRLTIDGYADTDYPPGGRIRCVTLDQRGARILEVGPEHGEFIPGEQPDWS